jgi:Rrf2 family nitric oxide-sensitive transcriptional repressor
LNPVEVEVTMFSERHRYILKLLTYLASRDEREYKTMASLCEELTIPRGYLNQLIPELVDLGYLVSKKGRGGGVRLALDPEDIEMLALLNDTNALDHPDDATHESCCVPAYFDRCIVDLWMDDFQRDVLGEPTLAEACDRMGGIRTKPSDSEESSDA